jgi:hypothetical protein
MLHEQIEERKPSLAEEVVEMLGFVPCILSLHDVKNGYDVQLPAHSDAWCQNSNIGVTLIVAPHDDTSYGGYNGYAVAKLTADNARKLAARLMAAAERFEDPSCKPEYEYGEDLLAPIYGGDEIKCACGRW